jgi:hypothetical protein
MRCKVEDGGGGVAAGGRAGIRSQERQVNCELSAALGQSACGRVGFGWRGRRGRRWRIGRKLYMG